MPRFLAVIFFSFKIRYPKHAIDIFVQFQLDLPVSTTSLRFYTALFRCFVTFVSTYFYNLDGIDMKPSDKTTPLYISATKISLSLYIKVLTISNYC